MILINYSNLFSDLPDESKVWFAVLYSYSHVNKYFVAPHNGKCLYDLNIL